MKKEIARRHYTYLCHDCGETFKSLISPLNHSAKVKCKCGCGLVAHIDRDTVVLNKVLGRVK